VIRVVVADDQPLIRTGLRVLLEDDPLTELVGEAADGAAAVAVVRRERPDVVLMDVRMPVLDGLAALRQITADTALSAVKVIVLTTFELDEYVFEALHGGASGFLLKDAPPVELLRAVHVVAAGESVLAPSVTRRLIEHFAARISPSPQQYPLLDSLTDREREIVAWVATGRSNDEIASALVLSSATVRTHVSRAMTKLQARDRAQLAVLGIRAGLDVPD
jgi:DNA-binding NarL/FixJ family response regulator